ncbi:MAG: molybdopterin cofactor-binding domain-containing protein, partial [Pseudomonadota bacterium]
MQKFGLSQPVRRVEDVRFLSGSGTYIDDTAPREALHGVFVRAEVAHAEIASINTAKALAAPGVHGVYTGADIEAAMENDMDAGRIPNRDGTLSVRPVRPILATGRVRHVGEAVALVVAETLAAAKDAAELVDIAYGELPAVVDPTEAEAPGQPQLHDEAPGNLCYDWGIGDHDATEHALASAAHTVDLSLVNNRIVANAMETRGAWGDWDGERLTMHYNGQGVWDLKGELVTRLGLPEDKVAVFTPDVGGGFGMKGFNYPEHFALAHAIRSLGRPVRWLAERGEGFQTDVAGRDQHAALVAGFDAEHRMIALKIETTANLGAYLSAAAVYIASDLAARVLTGVYDIQNAWFNVRGVFTNTTPVDAYRGAGRPEAQYQLERLMDKAARVL